jgi:alpha-ketoglutarate-dependent taurine dioxygenase
MDQTHPPLSSAELDGGGVRVAWRDGVEAQFAAPWLADNAPSSLAPFGGQRLRTARDLALAGPLRAVALEADGLRLSFAEETILWPGAKLRAFATAMRPASARILWASGAQVADEASIALEAYLGDDAVLADALRAVARLGVVRFTGAGDRLDEVERIVGRFGFIRETNYGRLFEVRVVAEPGHLADTARPLEPHTDNPYREPAPSLQLLHCIRSAGDGGGATFFLDGFALAQDIRRRRPEDFALLAAHPAPFAYATPTGDRYAARTPILRVTADGEVTGVRFNHRALGAVDFGPEATASWYEAYLRFAADADAPERRLSLTLQPGDVVMFDNERILHGRTAFDGATDRLLTGCYAERDGLLATLARLGG